MFGASTNAAAKREVYKVAGIQGAFDETELSGGGANRRKAFQTKGRQED